jgi:hypothetical protein
VHAPASQWYVLGAHGILQKIGSPTAEELMEEESGDKSLFCDLKAPNHREGSIALHMESEREHMLGVTET